MSQHDLDIANQTFPNTRSDLNDALQALGSTSSGATVPSTTYANQLWYDTANNKLYIRNEDNDANIEICELDQTNDSVEFFKSDSVRTTLIEYSDGTDALTVGSSGELTTSSTLDVDGNELILDSDGDTSITADTDDQIDIKIGGTDRLSISSTGKVTSTQTGGASNFEIQTTADSTLGADLTLYQNSASPADNDIVSFISFAGNDDGGTKTTYAQIRGTATDVTDTTEDGMITFFTTGGGTLSEKIRIDSSGNVGIGTTSPSGKLTVSDTGEDNALYVLGGIKQDDGPGNPWYLGKGILGSTGSEFLIGNGSSELLRIEQTGDVGIGTTSPTGKFTVKQTGFGATNTTFDSSHGTTPQGIIIDFSSASPDNNSQTFLTCRDSTTDRLKIFSDGDIDNHDNSYSGFSDVRLKEQITDSGSQWEDIKNLRVRKFKFKQDVSEKGDSDDLLRLGVIAQELESSGMGGLVSTKPEILWTDEDELPVDEDGNPTVSVGDVKSEEIKSVKYSILYMKAVKALQEAMDRIETLEAKVTALENN